MITILYVPATEPAETREIEPRLAALQELVSGDIQMLGGPDWSAYLNEHGKLEGLAGNAVATLLAF